MKKVISTAFIIALIFALSGCSSNRAYKTWSIDPHVHSTINESIIDLSDQLFESSRVKKGDKVAVTSFVDLHKLNKTSFFGRKLGESFFNELHVRGFRVIDIRGTKAIRINAGGEFFISRDISLLDKKRVENTYVLVGTYTKFGEGVMLNARIIDNVSGEIVSTARSIIHINDCDLYENCKKPTPSVVVKNNKKIYSPKIRTIGIEDAGCSKVTCPKNCVGEECYENFFIAQEKPMQKRKIRNRCKCSAVR
jgi:TolB-like protein